MTEMTAELIATVAASAAKATLEHAAARTPSTPTTTRKPVATPKPVKPPRRAPMTAAQLARVREHMAVAVHESGHCIAGVIYGAELRNAVASNGKVTGLQGHTYFYEAPRERQPEISFAGPWSEARFLNGGQRPTMRQLHALFDGHGLSDFAELNLAGGVHLGHAVAPLIERTWPAVQTLARQLYDTGEVFEADVLAALGVDDGGGRTSTQLALLRSNMRSVPPFTT
ncbi:Uncharacterised protein [Mycobacteroides abscessus subsp. bolletii]|uniref:hypothetical protein n=1 Tax=Mycobacteroides abscessus TaxID=36809 RepID=UPI000925D4F4|nr:hypothetical protein [Mycobacteroides abscessus]SIJ61864.1 Uncharacterised protein [Mycobacteroides abscessus subsp. bolletii]